MQDDYYSVLARIITATMADQRQLRLMVYDLARQKLRRQLYLQHQHLPLPRMQHQLMELEAAIARIEADVAEDIPLPSLPRQSPLDDARPEDGLTGTDIVLHQSAIQATVLNTELVEILNPVTPAPSSQQRIEFVEPLPPLQQYDVPHSPVQVEPASPSRPRFLLQLVGAAAIGVAIFAAFSHSAGLLKLMGFKPPAQALAAANPAQDTPVPQAAAHPPNPGFPIPSSYGVYALDDGKLAGLDALAMRVPDSRVAISGSITTPSAIMLADGKVQFVVFRRNLANDAPDRVEVRVVAEVMHKLTFADGKAVRNDAEGPWAVRGNSYQMKVMPVEGYPEMIVIRPQTEDFTFPAGRYVLMLNNIAYDFTVAGPITDQAHCLELTVMQDARLYSECRIP